jgi:tRNA (cytidine/uridine-2'-O-)-methyltransferase
MQDYAMGIIFNNYSVKSIKSYGKANFFLELNTGWAYNFIKKILRPAFSRSGHLERSMIDIILVEPEIPMNTGNIARTCAATGSRLHLIKPLGFDISDKAVKRAGLDYWHLVEVLVYDSVEDFFAKNGDENLYLATTKAPRSYDGVDMTGDVKLMFGKETAGLPEYLREKYRDRCVRIPIREEARSLNLANSVAILCFEVLRQQGFPHLKSTGSMMDK